MILYPVPRRSRSSQRKMQRLLHKLLHLFSASVSCVSPSSSFSLTAERDVIWYGISLWSVWVSCPGSVPSQDLAHPQPTGEGGNFGETALMLWEHCSAGAKTLVCYQHRSSYQYRAQHYEGCYGEN